MISVPDQVLASLCAQHHILPGILVFLGGGRIDSDGITYVYPYANRQRVLKVLALPAQDQDALLRVQERLKFVHFLSEQGVDIVSPLAGTAGSLLATQPDGDHLFIAYTMEKVDGVHAKNKLFDDNFVFRYGKLLGKLHHASQRYPSWQKSLIDATTGKTILGWEEEWQGFYDWCADSQVKAKWITIRDKLQALPMHREVFGFTHNDPHIQNLLDCGNRLVLLDFDVANYHWFINDIAIATQPVLFSRAGGLSGPVKDVDSLVRFLAGLIRGYRTENDLADVWIDQIDLFIAYRRVLLFTVMQDWLSKKPDMRDAWKRTILNETAILTR